MQLFFNGQKNGLYSLLEAADQEYVFNRNFPDYDPNNYALYKVKTWAGDCGSYTAYANQLAQQKLDNGFQPGQQPYAFERGTHVDPILTLSLFDFDQCGAEYDQWLENVWADTTLAYEHHNKDCGDLLVEEDFMDLDIGNKDFNNVMKEFVNNFYRGDDRCSEGCENKAGIKDVVDVDQFLRVFAFYAVGTISDSPLNSEHNFYMAQTGDGLGWKIMPYDFNTAASTSCREEVCGERMIYWSITRPTCFALEDSLLAGPLLTDSNLHAQFLTYAEEFVDKVYGNQTFWKELSAHIAAMGQYVRNDYYSVFGAYYEDELSPDAASWNDESGNFPLLPLMKARTEELRSQFDALRLGTFPRGVDDYDNYDSWEPCADWRISAPNRTMCPFQCMYEGCHMEGYTVESFCDEAEAICYHGDYDERCRGILDGEQYAGMEEGTFCQDASGIPVKAVSCPNATENSKLISQTSAAAKLLGDVVATVLVSLWLCLHL